MRFICEAVDRVVSIGGRHFTQELPNVAGPETAQGGASVEYLSLRQESAPGSEQEEEALGAQFVEIKEAHLHYMVSGRL